MTVRTEPISSHTWSLSQRGIQGMRFCFVHSLESCRNSVPLVVVAWPWQRAFTLSLLMGLTSGDGLTPAPCADLMSGFSILQWEACRHRRANQRGGVYTLEPMRMSLLWAFNSLSIQEDPHPQRVISKLAGLCAAVPTSFHHISSIQRCCKAGVRMNWVRNFSSVKY